MSIKSTSRLPVARIAAWLSRQAELALSDIDLSLPQYRILHVLSEGMALPSSLAERLDVRRPSITAVVDGLVGRGLVVREPDPIDRRKITHSITAEGQRLIAIADQAIEDRLTAVAGANDDPAAAAALINSLAEWGPALVAWHEKRHASTPVAS